jgi:hypothetical protein
MVDTADAKFKNRGDTKDWASVHGLILGVAIFYPDPAVLWKRLVGAMLAFVILEFVVQFRAIRRKT